MYTNKHFEAYRRENQAALDASLAVYNGPGALIVKAYPIMWYSGEFLGHKLREHGATEEQNSQIGFAHGQRCCGGDPVEWALKYLNEFVQTREVQDKPGEDLAWKVFTEAGKESDDP